MACCHVTVYDAVGYCAAALLLLLLRMRVCGAFLEYSLLSKRCRAFILFADILMPPRARPDLGSHKRARVDISAVGGASQCDLPSPIDTRFFTSKSMAACKRDFQAAKPFPHLRLTNFCDEDRMRAIREEITGRLHSKFKETDLYKVCGALKPCDRLPI